MNLALFRRISLAALACLATVATAVAGTVPASKAVAKVNQFVPLYDSCIAAADGINTTVAGCADTTGWVPIQTMYIKTANSKDLAIDTSFECGLTTFTGASGKNGGGSVDISAGRVRVLIRISDVDSNLNCVQGETNGVCNGARYALPGGLRSNSGYPVQDQRVGVVYCSRLQVLAANFGGWNCTADSETGVVTCDDDELTALLLRTLEASAFNFIAPDEPPGIKKVEVLALAETLDGTLTFGASEQGKGLSFSDAFIGAGSTLVEELRLAKGTDIIELPQE